MFTGDILSLLELYKKILDYLAARWLTARVFSTIVKTVAILLWEHEIHSQVNIDQQDLAF